jgi:hypothetical protein
MDWWYIYYILGGILLGWTIPWTILQISDGMFLLNQIFRIMYWGAVFISFEFTDWHWILCLLAGFIPGSLIWGCYDHWFDEGDEFQKIGDDLEIGTPIEHTTKTDTIIVWNAPEPSL